MTLLGPLSERRPDYSEVVYRLAEAHWLLDERSEAAPIYRRYLEMEGNAELSQKARERLAALEEAGHGR